MKRLNEHHKVVAGPRRLAVVTAAIAVVAASCGSSGDDGNAAASAQGSTPTSNTAAPAPTEPTAVPADTVPADTAPADATPSVAIDATFPLADGSKDEGTFIVEAGSELLGCASGAISEFPGRDGINVQMSCTDGARQGTFTVAAQPFGTPPNLRSAFEVIAATGDYADITGSGVWKGKLGESQNTMTMTGDIAFGEVATPVTVFPRLTQFRTSECWEGYGATDGLAEYATVGEEMLRLDLATGEVTQHGPAPSPCSPWLGDEELGRRIAHTQMGDTFWFGPLDGEWDVELQFERSPTLLSRSLAANRILLMENDEIVVRDATTGEPVGAPIVGNFSDSRLFEANAVNGDETLIAVGGASPEGGGLIIVLDAETAEEVFSVDTAAPVTTFVFDDAAGELVAGLFTGQVVTVDLAAQELVSEVETSGRATITAVGINPDDMIVVYTDGAAELVDRRSGPIDESIDMRASVAASIREDGTILSYTAAQNLEVYEIDG